MQFRTTDSPSRRPAALAPLYFAPSVLLQCHELQKCCEFAISVQKVDGASCPDVSQTLKGVEKPSHMAGTRTPSAATRRDDERAHLPGAWATSLLSHSAHAQDGGMRLGHCAIYARRRLVYHLQISASYHIHDSELAGREILQCLENSD